MLTVLDESGSRSDLAKRRETKFTLRNADVGKVRRLLEGNARRLVHNKPVSTVRSIYFDDVRLSACHANINGLGQRRKVRIRWYDQLTPGNEFYLEVKWRDNRVTGKHRLNVRSDRALHELPYRQLIRALIDSTPSHLLTNVLDSSEPIVIVEYHREHFVSEDGKTRVTIDYDLAFYDQTGKQFISTNFPIRMENFIVLEGKTRIGSEQDLRRLFFPLTVRPSRCSKYVHGCHALGLIQGQV